MRYIAVLALLLFVELSATAQNLDSTANAKVTASDAQLKLLANGFGFTEGPVADSKGNVYFTDQPNNLILRWSTTGILSVFMFNAGRSNGLDIDKKGNIIACADLNNQLWAISPKGRQSVLLRDVQGTKFNGPNDCWVDRRNGIYFTDPYYERPYWNRGPKEISENVYYLYKHKLITVADDFVKPNGIVGSPDGKILYIADIGAGKTYAYTILPNGQLADKRLFAEMGSDGMTVDEEGNVYLTGKGVTVFDSTGKLIEQIDVPRDWTANVCFGGADRKTLFITAQDGLFAIAMRVKGIR